MNNDFISHLKTEADIVEIVGKYVSLNRVGSRYKACCPFHNEKTPSFYVDRGKQIYKCFGCGEGGDIYTFIEKIENVDFQDAVKIIANYVGVEVPKYNSNDSKEYELNKILKNINMETARYYYKSLVESSSPLNYLKNRGVSPDMIKAFGLGYADNSFKLLDLLKSKFKTEEILLSGIFYSNDNIITPIFKDRIMFPIFNNRREIIGFGGRNLGDYGPKYINSPETKLYSKKENLYGLHIARKNIQNNSIFLVEGYMDVISMHQNGYKNTVATLGTALTIEQTKIISKMAQNIFILYDSDAAGRKAALKALELIETNGSNTRVVLLEEFKDPDEFFKKKSNSEFLNVVNSSMDYLKFNIFEIRNKYDTGTSFGKDSFVKESVDFIKEYLKKPFSRQIYVEETLQFISNITGFSIKSIGTDIYGKYFSPKQFSMENQKDVKSIQFEQIEEEIDRKEKIILNGIINGKISTEEININDFVYKTNRLIFHQIRNKSFTGSLDEYSKELTPNDYHLLIKTVKNIKLDIRIAFLEEQQKQILSKKGSKSGNSALLIAKRIIDLKKEKK